MNKKSYKKEEENHSFYLSTNSSCTYSTAGHTGCHTVPTIQALKPH